MQGGVQGWVTLRAPSPCLTDGVSFMNAIDDDEDADAGKRNVMLTLVGGAPLALGCVWGRGGRGGRGGGGEGLVTQP